MERGNKLFLTEYYNHYRRMLLMDCHVIHDESEILHEEICKMLAWDDYGIIWC